MKSHIGCPFAFAFALLILHSYAILAPDFIDLSIFRASVQHVLDDILIQFRLSGADSTIVRIENYPQIPDVNKSPSIKCNNNIKLLQLVITFTKSNKSVSTPFNVSCGGQEINTVTNIRFSELVDQKSINLSWNITDQNVIYLLLHYWTIYFTRIQSHTIPIQQGRQGSFSLENLREKTWHQICTATIDIHWRTGRFQCFQILTDFSMTGPVRNINATADSQTIYLSWHPPEYKGDTPQRYHVNIYNIASKICRIFIINMVNIRTNKFVYKINPNNPIPNINPLCQLNRYLTWQTLETLEIDKLPEFTKFNIEITPVNRNKSSVKHSPISIQTKEGESEAVQNLTVQLTSDEWIDIKFAPPTRTKGVIKHYRIAVSEKANNMCTNANQSNGEMHLTNETKYAIKMKHFWKCRSYEVKVNPVNGWKLNEGVGKAAFSSYRYSLSHSIRSIDASFVSRNSFVIQINDSYIIDQCGAMGFIVEIINLHNYSECAVRVLLTNQCNHYLSMMRANRKISNCNNAEYKNIGNQSNSINVLFIGIAQYPIKYQWKIFLITDQIDQIHSGIVDNNHLHNCFTDCYERGTPYSGIVSTTKSGKVCDPWRQSSKYSAIKGAISNICSSKDKDYAMCLSNNLMSNCDVTNCNQINLVTGCVAISASKPENNSLTIHWSKPKYPQKVIGYATLLHNISHVCEQFNIQLYHKGRWDIIMNKCLSRFYISCANFSISHEIKHETRFTSLHQNKQFIIYIIPIVDANVIGEIINISIQTNLARPAIPRTIEMRSLSLSTIQLTWMKEVNFHQNGPAKYYNISILNSNSITLYATVSNESIIVTNLKMCSKYCFILSSGNDAGWSEVSKPHCIYTFAPKPGQIEVEEIQSRLSSSFELKWKYLGTDSCRKMYIIEYAVRHINGSEMRMRTNSTSIRLVNLTTNLIYKVNIRAENLEQSLNNDTYGEYSQTKQFYTGNDQLELTYYNQLMDENNQFLNISWRIPDQLIGSIFEFIILIKNHIGMCSHLIDLQCSNCPPPWNWTFLDDEASSKRRKLLNCSNSQKTEFNSSQNMFIYIANLTGELFDQSVDIYGINLLRVAKIKTNGTIVKKDKIKKPNKNIFLWLIVITSLAALFMLTIAILYVLKHQKLLRCKSSETEVKLIVEEVNNNSQSDTALLYISKVYIPESKPTPPDIRIYSKSHKNKKHGVKVSEFHKYYENCSQNKFAELTKEYKKLSTESKAVEVSLKLTDLSGKDPQNTKKNRFVNILPYDQHRVKLKNKTFPDDYINANYIPFLNDEKKIEYIASQGPIEGSLCQFWQMIWEQDISCIAMLTQTMEGDKFKCLQYWPDTISETGKYGDENSLAVTLLEENDLEGYKERKLLIRNLKSEEERIIIQLHMDTWNDFSAPNMEHFDKFLFRFQEVLFTGNYPYLVHCSAGVGRTGTLICIDRLVKELADGCQEINIYQTILKLRNYRNLMVQRAAQYIFIHEYMDNFIGKYLRTEDPSEALYYNED